MKICHLQTHSPDVTGGIETVVTHLRNGDDVRYIGTGGFGSLIRGFFLALKLRFSDYDVIHAHDNAGYWCTWVAKNKNLVFTAQGLWEDYFNMNPPRGIKKKLESKILLSMQSRLIRKSNAVVPITSIIKTRLQKKYGITPTSVVHNGVDTGLFRPSKGRKEFGYIWVGTNPESKRLKETIELAEKNSKNLLVIGTSGKNTKAIRYMRNVSRKNMPSVYNSAGTFVYFNKQKDYSLALLEAMASGLDIITLDYILEELTKAGKASGTMDLDGRRVKKVTLTGSMARKIAESELDWKVTRLKYKRIYNNVMYNE